MYLDYNNKKKESEILQESSKHILKEEPSKNINHFFLGDNFNILSGLNNTDFHNSIDLVYIDPPFATNNSFYIDKSGRASTISHKNEGILAYNDELVEEEYLEFIRERLIIIRELMSEKGSIYLHIDYKIGHYIKIIMDEVFGKENFLNDITRKKSNPKNFSRKAYGNEKDLILFYAKNKGENIFNNVRKTPSKKEIEKKYTKIDNDGKRYNTIPIHAPGESSGDTGKKWNGIFPPEGRHWRTSREKLDDYNKKGLIEWSKNNNPRLKKYETDYKGSKIQDIWLDYKDPQYPKYPTQKNQKMLDMIIKQSSNEDSFVLDAFSGSGSTLLSALKYGRKFLGIDKSKESFNVAKKLLSEDLFTEIKFHEN